MEKKLKRRCKFYIKNVTLNTTILKIWLRVSVLVHPILLCICKTVCFVHIVKWKKKQKQHFWH